MYIKFRKESLRFDDPIQNFPKEEDGKSIRGEMKHVDRTLFIHIIYLLV